MPGLALSIAVMWAAVPPPVVDEKPGLAALEIKAVAGVSKELAGLLTDALLTEMKASGRFASILGQADIQAMLQLEQQKMALDCEDASCMTELGGALGVPYLLTANLGQVGDQLLLNVRLIAVDKAEVIGRISEAYADPPGVLKGLKPLARQLLVEALGPKTPAASGSRARKPPWLALALGLSGAAVTGIGYRYALASEATFTTDPSPATYDQLKADVRTANQLVAGGWSLLAVATAGWWWTR